MTERKVAVVTGGSAGMGLATARELARRGYDLVLSSRDPQSAAEQIRSDFEVQVRVVAGSIADPGLAEHLATAAKALGGATALLLNHGGPPVKPIMALTDEDWTGAFQTMVTGPLRVMRALVPQLQANPTGRVLAISSFTVKTPFAGIGLSNALRAALVNALKTAALELGPGGVLVNALAPGYVETDRIREWNDSYARQENTNVEEIRARTLETIPLRRYGTPEGYARLAAFLLSEDNDYVSGQQIVYDGGLVVAISCLHCFSPGFRSTIRKPTKNMSHAPARLWQLSGGTLLCGAPRQRCSKAPMMGCAQWLCHFPTSIPHGAGMRQNNTPKRVDFGPRQWQTPLLCCLKRTSPSPSHRPRQAAFLEALGHIVHRTT